MWAVLQMSIMQAQSVTLQESIDKRIIAVQVQITDAGSAIKQFNEQLSTAQETIEQSKKEVADFRDQAQDDLSEMQFISAGTRAQFENTSIAFQAQVESSLAAARQVVANLQQQVTNATGAAELTLVQLRDNATAV